MKKFGGNIGYSIRPTERRKGYNKINLYLGLIKANKLNLDRVMLDCDVNNIGSDRTMKALGGVLERTEIDPYDGILTNVYWFDVKKCIDKYKDVYEKFIDNNNSACNIAAAVDSTSRLVPAADAAESCKRLR